MESSTAATVEDQLEQKTMSVHIKRLQFAHKWMSVMCGVALVTYGVLRYIFFKSISGQDFILFFQPGYLIIFGLIIMLVELDNPTVIDMLPFMETYYGRGIVAFFTATLCFTFVGSTHWKIFAGIMYLALLTIGIISIKLESKGAETLRSTVLMETFKSIKETADQTQAIAATNPDPPKDSQQNEDLV